MKNIHKKEYVTTLYEYTKLVNSLDDANKLNHKLLLENLELESDINELIDILKKITVTDYIEQDIYNSWLNKANSLIQKHTKK